MARIRILRALLGGASLAALLLAGCAGTPGNPFGMGTEGQKLLEVTKELRSAAYEPAPLPRELNKSLAPSYVVEPGDVLLVQPANLDSPARIPGDQPVLPDGTIHLGRYGRLVVVGKTVEQIQAEARTQVEAVTKDAGPIVARIVSRQSKVYYVLGEVNAPGSYPLQGRETVLDAILAAGGVNTRANLKGVTLSRPTPPDGCRIVLPICYEEIVQLGDTSTNYQIAAGDRVFVPARGLCDQLLRRNKDCPPCGRSQTPCDLHGPGCDAFHPATHVPGPDHQSAAPATPTPRAVTAVPMPVSRRLPPPASLGDR